MGYTKVRHLVEGIAGWEEAGETVEKGMGEIVPRRAPEPSPPSPRAETPPRSRARRAAAEARSRGLIARTLERMAGTTFEKLIGVWLTIVVGCGALYWLLDAFAMNDLREGAGMVPA